jgi:hypothetical protein
MPQLLQVLLFVPNQSFPIGPSPIGPSPIGQRPIGRHHSVGNLSGEMMVLPGFRAS